MEDKSGSAVRTVNIFKLLLKIAVTGLCLWYVFTNIDFDELKQILRTTNWIFLAAACGVFIISKFIASCRLNIFFKNISLYLKEKENLKLFWLGMFYNLFLPGSITGDAYKVVVLSKKFDIPYRKTTAAVMLDRFSGLIGLGLLLALYSVFTLENKMYSIVLTVAALTAVFALYFIVQRYFSQFLSGFWVTFVLGLAVQLLMLICIYAIIRSLHIEKGQHEYAFIFLIAAVAGVLPLTIGGGLGIREFVFYKGAIYFGLNEYTAVMISLLFYCVTLVTSLFGAIFIFKPVFSEKVASQ